MEKASRELVRKWAYLLYGVTMLAFAGGLIPALFTANVVATGISAMVILLAGILSLWMGRRGFVEEEEAGAQAAPGPATAPREAIQYTPLDPDEVIFDETNWRYARGENVTERKPSLPDR